MPRLKDILPVAQYPRKNGPQSPGTFGGENRQGLTKEQQREDEINAGVVMSLFAGAEKQNSESENS